MISSLHTPKPCETQTESDQRLRQSRRRQVFLLLFALVLACFASSASAQSPQSDCHVCDQPPDALGHVVALPLPIESGGAIPNNRSSRPAYVQLNAQIANWDADAEPDGWRARVVLVDRDDRRTARRANATFELMPRVALQGGEYVDAQSKAIRWTMPLKFDDHDVAEVKLPLRQALRPMLGWSRLTEPAFGTGSRWEFNRQSIPSDPRRTLAIRDVRDAIARPSLGELRVRVSVPTEGTFQAATGVQIRPSVLVDTSWPYR